MTLQSADACDREIWLHGETVCTFHAPSKIAEDWVRMVSAFSGARVDWGYVAGYCVVRCLGNRRSVEHTIEQCLPFLNAERFRMVPRETAWSRFWYRCGRALGRLWPLALLCACEVELPARARVIGIPTRWEMFTERAQADTEHALWMFGMDLHEIKRDQLHIDESLVFCERVAFGDFEHCSESRYCCVRGAEVLWDTQIGYAFDPLRMRAALADPRAPEISRKRAAPPWASYRP